MNCIARAILFSLVLWPLYAYAHSGSSSYIRVVENDASMSISMSLDLLDLHYALDLDANVDGSLKWAEIVRAQERVHQFVANALVIQRDGARCGLALRDIQIEHIDELVYVVLDGKATCPRKGQATLSSALFFDLDTDHRSLVSWQQGTIESLAVMSARQRSVQGPIDRTSAFRQVSSFAVEGMWHIWAGIDHLAFLLILLLPASIARGAQNSLDWRRVIGIVSAFTVAHSVTLALSITGLVSLPERLVEIAIAGSVVVAALAGLSPKAHSLGGVTAFCFGLLHGFGFAAALQDLEVQGASLGLALLGFNLGVEAGQLAVVVTTMPVFAVLRKRVVCAAKVLPAACCAVAIAGMVWVWERAVP